MAIDKILSASLASGITSNILEVLSSPCNGTQNHSTRVVHIQCQI